MNISLELYKNFYYVAKNQSITLASNEMLVSQPAVSRSIKTLEDQLDVTLFIRKREGVLLTDAGEKLFAKIKPSMELLISAEDDMKFLANEDCGTINIFCNKSILRFYLSKYIVKFNKLYPNVKFCLKTGNAKELLNSNHANVNDVYFAINLGSFVPENYVSNKLLSLHPVFIASKDNDKYKDKIIKDTDLEKLPVMGLSKGAVSRLLIDNYLLSKNINLNYKIELNGFISIIDFTKQGFGVGCYIKEYLDSNDDVYILNTETELPEMELSIIYNKNKKFNSNVVNKFIEYIEEQKN